MARHAIRTRIKDLFQSIISSHTYVNIEQLYPQTLKMLFCLARLICKGECGEKIKTFFTLEVPSSDVIAALLKLTAHKLNKNPIELTLGPKNHLTISEIENLLLDPNGSFSNSKWDPQTHEIISHYFHHYFDHLMNPSSHLVDLLVKMKFNREAYLTAHTLKNPTDHSRAFAILLQAAAETENFIQALKVWKQITVVEERRKSTTFLIKKMTSLRLFDQIEKFIIEIPDEQEKNEALKAAAFSAAYVNFNDIACRFIELMDEQDDKDYVMSLQTQIYAKRMLFDKAKETAFSIQDRGFRDDALIFIVKAYLHFRRIDKAMQFVDTLSNEHEKKNSAKIIEMALKSYHQDEKVKAVRKFFSINAA